MAIDYMREFARAAEALADTCREAEIALRRCMSADATFREFLAYERLAENQQILTKRVANLHAMASGQIQGIPHDQISLH